MKNQLIQPNSVTNARYEFSPIQKNLLYHILENLQHRMEREDLGTKEEEFLLEMSELDKNKNYDQIIEQGKKMLQMIVEYKHTRTDGEWNVCTGIISAFEYRIETGSQGSDKGFIKIVIPSRAIPFLCYIGNGFTSFQKTVALSLRSIYSKRIYELCCRWSDKGGFVMTLEEFKEILNIKNKYSKLSDLKKSVLEHAKQDLLEYSNIYFNYSLKKVHSRSYNMIHFTIFDAKKTDKTKQKAGKYYSFVYGWMKRVFPKNAIEMADKINEDINTLKDVYERLKKLDDELTTGKKKQIDVIKITKYFLKEDYDITI